MKRIISVLLTITMIFGMMAIIPLNVSATDIEIYTDSSGNRLRLSKFNNGSESGYKIVGCEGSPIGVEIPDMVNNLPVLEIGTRAFYGCSSLIHVQINSSVTTIGDYAFAYTGITEITLPDSVISMSNYVFYGCRNLQRVKLPNNLSCISGGAFSYCESLTDIEIPESVERIKGSAFEMCSGLYSITIPGDIVEIGDYAFEHCTKLNNVCFTPTKVAPTESNGTIGDYAFSYCDNLYRITIPENIGFITPLAFYGDYSLDWIDVSSGNTKLASRSGILYNKNITKLICYPPSYYGYFYDNNFIVPDTVTVIGSNAFNGVHLLCNVILPDGVTAIENNAFSGCYNLGAITIPDSVTTISDGAFWNCGKLSDVFYSGTKSEWESISISDRNDSLKNATIHYEFPIENTYVYYDYYNENLLLFEDVYDGNDLGCKLVGYVGDPECFETPHYVKGKKVLEIADKAFYGCDSLKTVDIGDSVTTIGESAFEMCENLTEVTLPDSVTTIETYAFARSGIINIKIPEGVSCIDRAVFSGCSDLKTVILPQNLKYINDLAFLSCGSLVDIEIPDCVEYIGYSAFDGCSSLTSIKLPSGMCSSTGSGCIPMFAFFNCTSLTDVTIPEGIVGIYDYAFSYCSALKEIEFPDSLNYISDNAFSHSGLTNVTIKENVNYICSSAFENCDQLRGFDVSTENKNYCSVDGILFNKNKTTLFCYPAINNCYANTYTIPNGVTKIERSAFNNCNYLESIILPSSLKTIESSTFSPCRYLKSITIPKSVTTIERSAFSYCHELTDVYYTGTQSDWENIAIEDRNDYLQEATIHYEYKLPVTNDVNGDGRLAVDDVIYVLKNIVGDLELTDEQLVTADVNSDGTVTVLDVVLLQRLIVYA